MEFLRDCLTIILVIKAEIILNKSCTWCFVRKKWQYCIKIRAKIFAVRFTWLSSKLNITQSILSNIPTFATIYSNTSYRYCIFAEIISLIAENGGYPPTQNGDIRSLFWLFSLMALQKLVISVGFCTFYVAFLAHGGSFQLKAHACVHQPVEDGVFWVDWCMYCLTLLPRVC